MIFADSDVYVIDQLYKRDKRYETNHKFLEENTTSTSIFNVLEICGICSFQMNESRVTELFKDFHRASNINVLLPNFLSFSEIIDESFKRIKKKMNFQDSLVLWVAEQNNVEYFITWNKKDFEGRTELKVLTPEEYFDLQNKSS